MEIIITEGAESTWNYHLSYKDKFTRGLCGKFTMITSLPLNSWGIKTHLHERYCETCKKIYEDSKNG